MAIQLFKATLVEPDAPTLDDIFRQAPIQFRRLDNAWGQFAGQMIRAGGANATDWKFRSKDPETKIQQMECLSVVVSVAMRAPDSETTYKANAVVAYMLSEMLTETPAFVPKSKSASTFV